MRHSFRLLLLNAFLRLVVKNALAVTKTPQQMRDQFERTAARLFRAPEDANFVADTIRRNGNGEPSGPSGSGGGLIEAVWASRGRPDRRRVILYLHGGAYLAGSSRTHRHLGAWLAGAAGVRALLPDYRLAPEHPFPAGLDDALIAYRHLLESGYSAQNIALAGDSAGGGLIFALLLKLRAEGRPDPACLVAFSPWLDMTMTRGSLRRNARRDVLLPVRRFREVVTHYLQGTMTTEPLASPIYGEFPDPPPTQIMVSKSEILRDDGVAMADKLRAAGGDVALELWKDMPHAWQIFAGMLPEADTAVEQAGQFIARHLRPEAGD
ncbi:MAG TPA: alpha/beta hydrolase [Thermohalobaculum sp.]|nr:alpha/beta hydrolase [Thermohalobaculum sp.]